MDASLEDDYEALVQFLYLAPIGLVQARLDGEILMVNPLCAQLLMPLSPDGCLSNLYSALQAVAPDLAHRVAAFEPGHGLICDSLQLRLSLNPADRRAVRHLSLSVLKLDASRIMAVIGDVTQSVQRERELRHSQAWMNTLVTGITDYALMTLDDQGRLSSWNPSVERTTGHARDSAEGHSCTIFYPSEDRPAAGPEERLQDRLHEADRSGWNLEEGWLQRADGRRFWGSCLIAPLHAPGEAQPEDRAYSLIIRDLTQQRELAETARQAVGHDHLTGLLSRRAFFDTADSELQRWRRTPRPLSLLIVDIDQLQAIGQQHGQQAGDAVLRHLAAGLSATFRTQDVVARLTASEFALLLPGATADNAEAVAQRLSANVTAQTVKVGGEPLRYTLSLGLAAMDEQVGNLDALLARAQHALQAARQQGGHRLQRWQPALPHAVAPTPPATQGLATAN